MKKNLFLAVAAIFLLFTACNNDNKNDYKDETNNAVVVEETDIEEVPNRSDLDFDDALVAFAEGDRSGAADYIYYAIADLEEEMEDFTSEEKAEMSQTFVALRDLAKRIKNGEIKDITVLELNFTEAEMMIAHDYLVVSDYYALKEPERAKKLWKHAITRIDNAAKRLKGDAQTDAKAIIADSNKMIKRGDAKANEIGNAVGKEVEKMTGWFKKHAKAMGIKAPPYDGQE